MSIQLETAFLEWKLLFASWRGSKRGIRKLMHYLQNVEGLLIDRDFSLLLQEIKTYINASGNYANPYRFIVQQGMFTWVVKTANFQLLNKELDALISDNIFVPAKNAVTQFMNIFHYSSKNKLQVMMLGMMLSARVGAAQSNQPIKSNVDMTAAALCPENGIICQQYIDMSSQPQLNHQANNDLFEQLDHRIKIDKSLNKVFTKEKLAASKRQMINRIIYVINKFSDETYLKEVFLSDTTNIVLNNDRAPHFEGHSSTLFLTIHDMREEIVGWIRSLLHEPWHGFNSQSHLASELPPVQMPQPALEQRYKDDSAVPFFPRNCLESSGFRHAVKQDYEEKIVECRKIIDKVMADKMLTLDEERFLEEVLDLIKEPNQFMPYFFQNADNTKSGNLDLTKKTMGLTLAEILAADSYQEQFDGIEEYHSYLKQHRKYDLARLNMFIEYIEKPYHITARKWLLSDVEITEFDAVLQEIPRRLREFFFRHRENYHQQKQERLKQDSQPAKIPNQPLEMAVGGLCQYASDCIPTCDSIRLRR